MSACYAVYGYTCTKKCKFDGYSITPISNDAHEIGNRASDKASYKLTSFLRIEDDFDSNYSDLDSFIFNLEGVLALIEQQDVFIDRKPFAGNKKHVEDINIIAQRPRRSQPFLFSWHTDNFRRDIICRMMDEIYVGQHNEEFKTALFKYIEYYRMSVLYMDVHYYLIFSGLEALSRAHRDYTGKSAASVLRDFIAFDCGFCSFVENPGNIIFDTDISEGNEIAHELSDNELRQFVESTLPYVYVRNSLVHNG